jgi:hypothetical protein
LHLLQLLQLRDHVFLGCFRGRSLLLFERPQSRLLVGLALLALGSFLPRYVGATADDGGSRKRSSHEWHRSSSSARGVLGGSNLIQGRAAASNADEDMKTSALARLPAVVSLGAPTTSCQWSAELAREAGATEEEIVGVLWAVGPIVGLARVVATAPALALAIGYDVEAAFEKPGE